MSIGWVTNDRKVAEALERAEAKYAEARAAAADLPLKEKVDVYRRASAELTQAYDAIKAEFAVGPREREMDECPKCGSRLHVETMHFGTSWVCTGLDCDYEGAST